MKLLIVDDSVLMRQMIESFSAERNFEIVGHAGNGKEALRLFQDKSPDLVTLDITMPEMNGLEALEEMMKINPEAKIIIITALSARETARTALKKGAATFLNKPFQKEELFAAFDEVFAEE